MKLQIPDILIIILFGYGTLSSMSKTGRVFNSIVFFAILMFLLYWGGLFV